jgi:DNA repair exonuclease SbcCD ATPase subunit
MTLTVIEIVILQLGAIVLGIAIHFFISSRRSLKTTSYGAEKTTTTEMEEWKSKYFNDLDERDKEITHLKESLADAEENTRIYRTEAEEMVRENRKLEAELETIKRTPVAPPIVQAPVEKPGYIDQLRIAQSGLMEHNDRINRLLEQIDVIKEKEEQQQQMIEEKEELSNQISKLRIVLGEKEKEINNIRQKEQLTKEMNSILDNAYNEFNILQGKIQKLELQLNQSKMLNVEYEDLKETHYKLIRDFDEQKTKLQTISAEHQQLSLQMDETTDRLREANFQRQQLQKRVSYLEELNNDLHVVADANKKLEGQLRKIGELESMLNVVSEERDDLLKKQTDYR